MPGIECPIDGVTYKTPDLEAVLAAALITAHSSVHTTARTLPAEVKPEKAKRPTISPGASSQDWEYFKTRWGDYKTATGDHWIFRW